ncbi:MAG TPA: cation:proton antiporter [Thermoanaerobaculia bacterium]|nr:cation:proton antiporter [Thermoanaerobaculia bacterium]
MHGVPLLQDLVVLLAAAVVIIVIGQRFRLHPVVGLLLAGILIGPSGLGLISEMAQVRLLAEIGVVSLLFTIGLEFSLERVRQIWRPFFVGGSQQALWTLLLSITVSLALGFSLQRAFFFGFLIVLSSTAIVLRLYGERNELGSPHGRLVLGTLLFQDFLVVPMIILTPMLAGVVAFSGRAVLIRFGGGILIVAAVFALAWYVMPRLLAVLVRARVREVLILGALLAGLGMSVLTESLQFSLALGAFLAGLIISESEYSHQVVADVLPFRDVFASIFFVSIGMLLNLEFFFDRIGTVFTFAAALVIGKFLITGLIVFFMRYPIRTAVMVGAGLAQIGEFSFVVANLGLKHGLLDPSLYQMFLSASVLTMMATPLLVAVAPRVAPIIETWIPYGVRGSSDKPEGHALERHVIIVGWGVNGRNLARVLREVHIGYRIIELDGDLVRKARRQGEPIIFGDAARKEILELAGIHQANSIVFGISDPLAVRRAVRFARDLNSQIHIIVRTRMLAEIDEIYALGATDVFAEEFETSIEIFTRVLERYHVPRNIIQAQREVLRSEKYEVFREPGSRPGISESVLQILTGGITDIFRIADDSFAAGKTLQELDVRKVTGASVIAVVRDQSSHPSPSADFRLQPHDFVVLVGAHQEMDRAFTWLGSGQLP